MTRSTGLTLGRQAARVSHKLRDTGRFALVETMSTGGGYEYEYESTDNNEATDDKQTTTTNPPPRPRPEPTKTTTATDDAGACVCSHAAQGGAAEWVWGGQDDEEAEETGPAVQAPAAEAWAAPDSRV